MTYKKIVENVYTQSTRKIVSVADNLNSVSIVKKLYSCTNGSCTSAKSTSNINFL